MTHKTTILLSPQEHRRLVAEARRRKMTLGELFRQAVRSIYRLDRGAVSSDQAWNRLFKANAPVGEWDEMAAEIERGRLET